MTTAPKFDTAIAPTPNPGDDAAERKSLSTYVRENPAAFIAGGVVLGVVLGALIPKRAGASLTKRAFALAATASEFGLIASRQVRDSAERAAHEAKDLIDTDTVREKAGQLADVAREAGHKVVERASSLASRLKH